VLRCSCGDKSRHNCVNGPRFKPIAKLLFNNGGGKRLKENIVPCGRKRKRKKIATHKRKKKLRKNRHKKKK
jgi:hypothetical protein